MTYPKALATLDAILKLIQVPIYDQCRDDEHAYAGTVCAATLHDRRLKVRFIAVPNGFCMEIEQPSEFFAYPGVMDSPLEIPGDRNFSELGGSDPILRAFYGLDDYHRALIRTMGDPRELRISASAFAAFARAAESWRPANNDRPQLISTTVRA